MNETYEEPHYHTWHIWVTLITWGVALAVGIPAALMVKHNPGLDFRNPMRPGCFLPTYPFRDVYSYTINDPGFNFSLSLIVVMYLFMALVLIGLLILIFCRKTRNNKYRRYVKILLCMSVLFVATRAPMDFLQLKGLIEAAMGFRQLNPLPYEAEYEVLLIWCTYLPIIFNPIIYLSFVSEFRNGAKRALKRLCGCDSGSEEDKKMEHYKEDEILETRSQVSKTQVSNML